MNENPIDGIHGKIESNSNKILIVLVLIAILITAKILVSGIEMVRRHNKEQRIEMEAESDNDVKDARQRVVDVINGQRVLMGLPKKKYKDYYDESDD
jgi:hypothetical protein